MKEYKVELAKPAQNYLSRLDAPTKKRIVNALRQLAIDPDTTTLDIKPLAGMPGYLRLRVGNYRIIYEIQQDIVVIYVIAIRPRGEVYKRL